MTNSSPSKSYIKAQPD